MYYGHYCIQLLVKEAAFGASFFLFSNAPVRTIVAPLRPRGDCMRIRRLSEILRAGPYRSVISVDGVVRREYRLAVQLLGKGLPACVIADLFQRQLTTESVFFFFGNFWVISHQLCRQRSGLKLKAKCNYHACFLCQTDFEPGAIAENTFSI